MSHNKFIFSKYEYEKNILKLHYSVDNEFEFVEIINFNPNNLDLRSLTTEEQKALELAFKYLHIMAGISYYKLFLPKNIEINTVTLNKDQADFFNKFYFNGLGEFSFKNNIDLRDKINFPYKDNQKNQNININLDDNLIVPIGGGKDSVVSLEILKQLKSTKLYTFSVNTAQPISECCKLSDCENILVTRQISPQLIEINKNLSKYSAYNGHVPITAIIAFISVCTGIIYNCNTTVISNEKSANIGNTMHNGVMVNHQWSKSFEAESAIHNFIKNYITPSFNYFSLLRPIYEIQIANLFSKIKKYDDVFSSCNKNFKIVKDKQYNKWCCECDKCRFVFLILSAFIKKDRLIKIFGNNLFNNENNYTGYQELVGLCNYKPFECVGEVNESILAFYLLKDSEYKDDIIVKKILNEIMLKYSINELEEIKNKYLGCDFNESILENKYKEILQKSLS